MIQDIEEESKTKFSMDVEFSFSFKGIQWPFLFYLAFSLRMCYHMEKHYISGMSDSKAASAASIILLHSGKSQCF